MEEQWQWGLEKVTCGQGFVVQSGILAKEFSKVVQYSDDNTWGVTMRAGSFLGMKKVVGGIEVRNW